MALLEGKNLIVFGGGNGIGAEVVRAYAEHGASVASFGINREAGEQVIAEAAERGKGHLSYRRVDIRDQDTVREGIDDAVREMGGVNGISVPAGMDQQSPAAQVTEKDIDDVFDVNVKGLMYAAAAAFPYLKVNGGSVTTYSSGAGVEGFPGMPVYSGAKGAVLGYTRAIAAEWGPYGIRANSICPSADTPMLVKFKEEMDPEMRRQTEALFAMKTPLGGKPGTPRDIANVDVFLASDLAGFITKQTVPVDGGFTPAT